MTNRERVLKEVHSVPTGLTDREIRERTGIEPHQQVNQICHLHASKGLIRRLMGPDGLIINVPIEAPDLSRRR